MITGALYRMKASFVTARMSYESPIYLLLQRFDARCPYRRPPAEHIVERPFSNVGGALRRSCLVKTPEASTVVNLLLTRTVGSVDTVKIKPWANINAILIGRLQLFIVLFIISGYCFLLLAYTSHFSGCLFLADESSSAATLAGTLFSQIEL